MTIRIGTPEKAVLYPAHILLQYEQFSGSYDVLLVKKSGHALSIGRNKVPQAEAPFSIGSWTVFLNGTLDLHKDKKGNPTLTVTRIRSKRYGVNMPALSNYADSNRVTAMRLRDYLKDAGMLLTQVNDIPWQSSAIESILYPYRSDAYFGIMDTIHLSANTGRIFFSDNNRIDNDTVFVTLNGKEVIGRTDLSKRNPVTDVTLDTGLNILIFHADNYGKIPPNTGKLNLDFGREKFAINFANKADLSATFIVAKLYYYPDPKLLVTLPELLRNTKLIDSIRSDAAEVTLAIWDDAVEDGDSISLNVNGQWLAKGFPVKKKPQFLKVLLQAGMNDIIFVADNVGAIPPNTSLLEIIDGKRRRSYMINTDLGKNNLVKISYDYNPADP